MTKAEREVFKRIGRIGGKIGGKKAAANMTPEQRIARAKKASDAATAARLARKNGGQ